MIELYPAIDVRVKQEIQIRPFWYSDAWLFPKLVTIVTTLDAEGRLNAAPLFGTRAAEPILAAVMCDRINRPDI